MSELNIILCCGRDGQVILIGTATKRPVPGEPVELRDARMVLYWSRECGGLLGLAARGPKTSTRITHAVPRVMETVWQEWVEMTPEAVEAMRSWPAC